MGRLILVLGGVRSGKSRFAEGLAATEPPLTYLATARAGDAEMARRIARHRERRRLSVASWQTVEEPWDVSGAARRHLASGGTVLLECLTLWLTNLVLGMDGRDGLPDEEVLARMDELKEVVAQGSGRLVVVSNEVGWGIVPVSELARRFADLLGEANQRLAAAADEVHVCVAGLPLRWK